MHTYTAVHAASQVKVRVPKCAHDTDCAIETWAAARGVAGGGMLTFSAALPTRTVCRWGIVVCDALPKCDAQRPKGANVHVTHVTETRHCERGLGKGDGKREMVDGSEECTCAPGRWHKNKSQKARNNSRRRSSLFRVDQLAHPSTSLLNYSYLSSSNTNRCAAAYTSNGNPSGLMSSIGTFGTSINSNQAFYQFPTVKLVVGATGKAQLVLRTNTCNTELVDRTSKQAIMTDLNTKYPYTDISDTASMADISTTTTNNTSNTFGGALSRRRSGGSAFAPSTPEDEPTPLLVVARTVDVHATQALSLKDMDMSNIDYLRRWQFTPHMAAVPCVVDFVDLCKPWSTASTSLEHGGAKHVVVLAYDPARQLRTDPMPSTKETARDVVVVIATPKPTTTSDLGGKFIRLVSVATKFLPTQGRFTLVGIEAFVNAWFTVRTSDDHVKAVAMLRKIAMGSLVSAFRTLHGDPDLMDEEAEAYIDILTHDEYRACMGDEVYENETVE